MNKKIPLGTALALMIITAALTISMTMVIAMSRFDSQVKDINERASMFNHLTELDTKARQNFIGTIDEKKLRDEIARGYIKGMNDKYATYFDSEEYERISGNLTGNMVGIGVKVYPDDDGNIFVYDVVADSPAKQAGVQKGDIVFSVENKLVTDIGYTAATDLLMGKEGTKASFVVLRGGEEKSFEIVHVRFTTVSVSSRMIGNVGYVAIDEFNDNTSGQFMAAVDKLVSDGAAGLVFDVRNNPGGTLKSVASILDYLLPSGNIVSSTDKQGNTKVLYTSDAKCIELPMSVLINDHSASASELFSCALRDYNLAKLVGVKSYGKGTIQEFFRMDDGSGIDISIATFNPPKSANFEGVGLTPDVEVKLSETQTKNFYLLTEQDDPQLQAALALIPNYTAAASTTINPPGSSAVQSSAPATGTDVSDQLVSYTDIMYRSRSMLIL